MSRTLPPANRPEAPFHFQYEVNGVRTTTALSPQAVMLVNSLSDATALVGRSSTSQQHEGDGPEVATTFAEQAVTRPRSLSNASTLVEAAPNPPENINENQSDNSILKKSTETPPAEPWEQLETTTQAQPGVLVVRRSST
ncbi:MAG: hypothetical protein Q9160_000577 [Pyrenula sp. 1 TL-2023]